VGNDFSFESLCGVTGFAEDKVLDLMEQMLKTGLVKERVIRGQDVYSFADIIVRDVAHEEVSHLRHKKLHGIVGSALEKVYEKKIDEHLGELAWHFLEFGDEDKALGYFLKAGDRAAKIYANNEAVSYFQHALDLLEKKEGELREKARVLERLGDIKELVGQYEGCMKHWADALQLWNQLFEKADVARLHRKLANVLWEDVGVAEKAKEHYDKALKILEAEGESVELASLFDDLAHMYYRTNDVAQARSWAEKALDLAKKLNAFDVMASSYASLGTALNMGGDWRKAVECHERALKIALDNGLFETALRAYNNLAIALPWEEAEKAMRCSEKGLELAKKVGDIRLVSWLGVSVAWWCLGMGDTEKAVSMVEDSVALDRKTGNMPNLALSVGHLGVARFVLGEWDKAEQYLREALTLSQKLNQHQQVSSNLLYLGLLYSGRADFVKAKGFFEKACEVCEKAGAKYTQMYFFAWLGSALVELGEIEKASNLVGIVHKFALEVKDRMLIAMAEALNGMVLRAQKRWEESVEHFEKSLREAEALDIRHRNVYFLAKMFLSEYARVYLERNQEGDREKAYNLLNQALEIFEKMGARKEIENIIAKKKLLTA
jgi:tetratricopeptide (TPR) repeat protein